MAIVTEISQEDRVAAAGLINSYFVNDPKMDKLAQSVLSGNADYSPFVKKMRDHRVEVLRSAENLTIEQKHGFLPAITIEDVPSSCRTGRMVTKNPNIDNGFGRYSSDTRNDEGYHLDYSALEKYALVLSAQISNAPSEEVAVQAYTRLPKDKRMIVTRYLQRLDRMDQTRDEQLSLVVLIYEELFGR